MIIERKHNKYGYFLKLTFKDEEEFEKIINMFETVKNKYSFFFDDEDSCYDVNRIINIMKDKKTTKYKDELTTIIPEDYSRILFGLTFDLAHLLEFISRPIKE